MRKNSTPFVTELRCPLCKKGRFYFEGAGEKEDGAIRCHRCAETFPVIDGIYHFLNHRKSLSGVDYTRPDWPMKERQREKMYEREHGFDHSWLRSLPFPEIETETTFQKKHGNLGQNFYDVLDHLCLRGTESVFDMAAGCCWTSNEFAKRGCRVVSTDIRTIKYHGLRSAEAYFEMGETNFERLCWTFGTIPFDDKTFDVIFCQNAFQYVEDLNKMVTEVYRVLKPGGKLVFAWTGARAPFKSKSWGPGYYLTTYLYHVRSCGFYISEVFPPISLFGNSSSLFERSRIGFSRIASPFLSRRETIGTFRSVVLRVGSLPISFLFGVPFNMIACKA